MTENNNINENEVDTKTINKTNEPQSIKNNLVLKGLFIGGAVFVIASIIWAIVWMGSNKKNTNSNTSDTNDSNGYSLSENISESNSDGVLSNNDSTSGESGSMLSTSGSKSGISKNSSSPSVTTPVIKTANLSIWSAPAGTKENNSYSVFVRENGKQTWEQLFVYNVKIGHQEGNDPLRALVGMEYYGPVDTSMVNFDFNGKVDFKIVYQKSDLTSVAISPESYQIQPKKENNTIYFTIEQNESAPRKIMIRPNGDWEKNVLHIVTNPMEKAAPKTTDANVYLVQPGSEIPRVLPEGKTVYYFLPGIHTLPRGAWVEFDMGVSAQIDRFDFITGTELPFTVPGTQDFKIEYKDAATDAYKVCYEAKNNTLMNLSKVSFTPVKARYIRLVLLGNHATKTGSGYNYLNSNNVKEFRIYEKGTDNNLVKNKAIQGSSANYYAICDGNDSTNSFFGHIYSSESFFIAKDGYTMYLSAGSVVKGAINSDWKNNITIKGRGILDCSGLVHDPAGKYAEGRTSAIRSEYSDDILIEGITVLDAPMWGIITNHSQNPVVRNMNYFGSIVNSDGVHMSGVTNGLVEGCFIRTTDDLFVMYHYGPADGVKVRNSVFFSDGGRVVLLGMANSKGDIKNVTFENNDVLNVQNVWDIYKHGGAFSLWASGGNTISNTVFRNIRMEAFREPRIACIFQIKTIDESGWGSGKIDGVTFENLLYKGTGEAVSYALGDSEQFSVKNILFKNVMYGDRLITNDNHPGIEFRNYVYAVSFAK